MDFMILHQREQEMGSIAFIYSMQQHQARMEPQALGQGDGLARQSKRSTD